MKLNGGFRDVSLNKRLPAYLTRPPMNPVVVKSKVADGVTSGDVVVDFEDGNAKMECTTSHEMNENPGELLLVSNTNSSLFRRKSEIESQSEILLNSGTKRSSLKQVIYRLASYLSEKQDQELSDNEINWALAKVGLDTDETEESRDLVKCHVDVLNQRRKMLSLFRNNQKRKKFVCYICGRNFALYAHLRNHLETHSGKKPFHCPDCNKAFPTQSGLKRHVPKHSISRDFICDVCHKRYANQSYLKVHMRIHLDQKPYVCPICQRGFRQQTHLNHHLLTHSGEKPHLCEHCGQRFRQANTLEDHLLLHTGERPHQCPHCQLQFTHRVSLKLHMRSHEPNSLQSLQLQYEQQLQQQQQQPSAVVISQQHRHQQVIVTDE